ncbi:uncharacterized protein K02A2.6-like [Ochlerotatus camptorhynchus]|uniref:uncharacterized protein K02A2.6-like n=1 Tax=Ochlerotatus camptorhynchus TaxID=644619 RepID=UPI0031DF93F3
MSDNDLKQAILRLTELIANQQQQIRDLQQVNANQVGSEKIIESLSTGIDEFRYDPDGGLFFESWYARYDDVFKEDGKHLDDKAKVRLLLRKIGTQFHERYVNSVLPNHPRDLVFKETVKKLKKLLGRQKSLFIGRYQCLQYIKNDADDFSSYKHCEAFQIEKLSSDQFKTIRFVCGLQSPCDSDIRTRLIGKLEAEETASPADGATLKLENLVEECNRIINRKQDTKMIEKGCKDRSIVDAISRHSTSRKEKLPKTPCWFCGDLQYVKECPYQSHTCVNCKRKGHKEGYCSSSEKTSAKKRINLTKNRKYAKIEINGSTAILQLDCASDITIISKQTWIAVGKPVINSTEVIPGSASGDSIDILGEFNAEITVQDVRKEGRIFVTTNPDLNVLGIETIDQFDLWSVPFNSLVNTIQHNSNETMQSLQLKFPEVFQTSLGCCTGNALLEAKFSSCVEYNRLPPGVKSAPGAFQRPFIDSMVAGIPGGKPYLDDILIAGKIQQDHDRSLNAVIHRIHPAKPNAISEMPPPMNVSQLRSYLGAINYYGRFVGQMKELRAPLDRLLKKDAPWKRTTDCQKSFDRFKTHFDPNKKIIVAGDASRNGLGTVILHRFSNGSVKAGAQQERHSRLHRQSSSALGANDAAVSDIQFISAASFEHGDGLSRLMSCHSKPDEEYVNAALQTESDVKAILAYSTSNLPVTSDMISKGTQDDLVLPEVINYIRNGWPNTSISWTITQHPDALVARTDGRMDETLLDK